MVAITQSGWSCSCRQVKCSIRHPAAVSALQHRAENREQFEHDRRKWLGHNLMRQAGITGWDAASM